MSTEDEDTERRIAAQVTSMSTTVRKAAEQLTALANAMSSVNETDEIQLILSRRITALAYALADDARTTTYILSICHFDKRSGETS